MKKINPKYILIVSSLFISLFWALFVPMLEFPDEQAHFATVSLLADANRLPHISAYDVSIELDHTERLLGTYRDSRGLNRYTYHPEVKLQYSGNLYGPYEPEIMSLADHPDNRYHYVNKEAASYPPLYYWLAGFFYKLSGSTHLINRLFITRLFSVILASLNIYLSYLLGFEIFSRHRYAFSLASMVALQPMMVFVMSGINSDVLFNLLFTLFTLLSLKIINHGLNPNTALLSGLVIGLGILTKPQAYFMFPLLILAIIIRSLKEKTFTKNISKSVLVFVGLLLIAGWKERGNFIQIISLKKLPYFQSGTHPQAPEFIDYVKYSAQKLYAQNLVWYWGVFKWLGVVLPAFFWRLTNRLILLSGLGTLIYLYKVIKTKSQLISFDKFFFLVLSVIGYILIIFWYDWSYVRSRGVQVAVQARYYFPLFTTQMALLLNGFISLGWNQRLKSILSSFLILIFVALQLVGIYTIATSYFDIVSISTLFTQASQYKPVFAKGMWWLLWSGLYIFSVIQFIKLNLKLKNDK